MVLAWIGIAVGVLIVLILIVKILKTPSYEAVSLEQRCKSCGYKITGIQCPICGKKSQ